MIKEIEEHYENQPEPNRSCILAVRDILLQLDDAITEKWKWKLPCFYYKDKMFAYLWKDKKTTLPYLAVYGKDVDHPLLDFGTRNTFKTFALNPELDIDREVLEKIVLEVLSYYD